MEWITHGIMALTGFLYGWRLCDNWHKHKNSPLEPPNTQGQPE